MQMHGITVICNCNKKMSVIVREELFSKIILIYPKLIDNSILLFYYIYCCKFTRYQVCLHVIPTASNRKQCTDNGCAIIQTT